MQHCRSSLISEQHVEIQARGHTGIGGMAHGSRIRRLAMVVRLVISGDEMASAVQGGTCGLHGVSVGVLNAGTVQGMMGHEHSARLGLPLQRNPTRGWDSTGWWSI